MLNITEIRVHLLDDSNTNLAGYASITIDNCFVIHGIKIIRGNRELFVSMPRRRRPGLPSQDICHPLSTEVRADIEQRVMEEYARVQGQTV